MFIMSVKSWNKSADIFGLIDMSIFISSVSQIFTSVCRSETHDAINRISSAITNILTHTGDIK